MGGWCADRERCGFHLTEDRRVVAERLCPLGEEQPIAIVGSSVRANVERGAAVLIASARERATVDAHSLKWAQFFVAHNHPLGRQLGTGAPQP